MNTVEKKILQKHLARFLVDEVFNLIEEEDLLKVHGSVWTYKGRDMSKVEIETIRSQAAGFKNSKLWEILKGELQWHGTNKIVEKAVSEEDLIAGKALMYLVDIIDSKLKSMTS